MKLTASVFLLAGLLPPLLHAETVVLRDPIQGETRGEMFGGTLTPDGYRPGVGSGHILYRLPETIREGYLQVEILGMDSSLVPTDHDHGFLAMYDGRGVEEPAEYFRDFKNNFFRWNFHWRNRRLVGAKCVITCAEPTPDRHAAPVAVFADAEARDWSKEPMGKFVPWSPEQWHILRLEWRDKTFRALIDGEEVWRATGPHDYAPVDHRVWIGSAPARPTKYESVIGNVLYRNLEIGSYADRQSGAAD